jgi:hypothetical protein
MNSFIKGPHNTGDGARASARFSVRIDAGLERFCAAWLSWIKAA